LVPRMGSSSVARDILFDIDSIVRGRSFSRGILTNAARKHL
jgi:hypothetical protein